MLDQRYTDLKSNLVRTGPCIIAFSGGVDSTFLLKVAHDVLGTAALAVTAVSASLAASEREAAISLARLIGAGHRMVETAEAEDPGYIANDGRRCYFCKRELFRVLGEIARQAGGLPVLYGAIPDDLGEDRPGMAAAGEAGVRAPLIEAGLTKSMIRELSKRLGLPTWDKPAMACLASRIPISMPVTIAALERIDRAEAAIRALGYRQVRVRIEADGSARIELDRAALEQALAPMGREALAGAVRSAGFRAVTVDPRGYRPSGGPVSRPRIESPSH